MIPRALTTTLVALGLFLPMVVCVLLGIGALLAAMGDTAGNAALERVRLILLILWVIDLVSLVLLLGLHQMGSPPVADDSSLLDE